jgi:hypothetical protein
VSAERPELSDERPPATFGSADKSESIVRVSAPATGRVDYDLGRRWIRFRWTWDLDGQSKRRSPEQIARVLYWPTEAIGLGTDRVAVAGVMNGRVVIELWTLGAGERSAPPFVAIESRVEILNEAQRERGPIYVLFFNPKPPEGFTDSMFLLFSASKELHRLDVRANDGHRVLTKVASPTPQPGVLVEPRLAEPFRVRWGAERAKEGYVYIFTGALGGAVKLDSLVLFDSDRDGRLDGSMSLSSADWNAGGWGDVASYVATFTF